MTRWWLSMLLNVLLLFSTALQANDLKHSLAEANQLLAEQAYEKSYQAFFMHAETNALAQFNLGLFEYYGWARPVNKTVACQWFEDAAAQHIPMAQLLLADCYAAGTHVPVNFEQASYWYQQAMQSGLSQAGCRLGQLHIDGRITALNREKGLGLCVQAAQAGAVSAQLYLAQWYSSDKNVNKQQALFWYQHAAQAKLPEAQYHAARLMVELGVASPAERLALAEAAAAQGYEPAYIMTAKLYLAAPLQVDTQMPTADNLAKAYLWAKAALSSTSKADKAQAHALLANIAAIMPPTWQASLDKKVALHLQRFSPNTMIQ